MEHPGVHLGVWYNEQELYVWGTVTSVPALCFVREVVEPGLLVAKHMVPAHRIDILLV